MMAYQILRNLARLYAVGWRRQRNQQSKVILSCAVNLNNVCCVLHEISSEKETEIDRDTHRKKKKKTGPVYLLRTFKEQNGE